MQDRRLLLALIKSLQDKEESSSTLIADLTNILYQMMDKNYHIFIKSTPRGSNKLKIAAINALSKIAASELRSPNGEFPE